MGPWFRMGDNRFGQLPPFAMFRREKGQIKPVPAFQPCADFIEVAFGSPGADIQILANDKDVHGSVRRRGEEKLKRRKEEKLKSCGAVELKGCEGRFEGYGVKGLKR